jgi:signal transduction histidine kinase
MELDRIATALDEAVDEVQEISRGIHPAIISHGGLGPALQALARRSPVPVEVELHIESRPPEAVEVAAYYIVSEALANVAKHARASGVQLSVATEDEVVRLSVRDNGIGGADIRSGSGLLGLRDRVDALGGTINVESPPDGGTTVVATLPLEGSPSGDGLP